MKKKIIALLLACSMVSLAACQFHIGPSTDNELSEEKDDKDSKKDKKKKDKDDDWESIDGKDDKKKKEDSLIKYSYQSVPVELKDGDDLLAAGCYVTIKLDDDTAGEYPELAETIELFNQGEGESLTSYLSGCEKEIRQMRAEGMPMNYEEDHFLHPERADDKAFSYVMEYYSFLGGAHGSTAYRAYNTDPSTGKDIKLDDVVKDTSSLPDIVVDELVKQNDDLEEYFESLEGGKDDVKELVKERLENNARDLVWGLRYDGIHIWFEDYAMGTYAAGARDVVVRFADYPDVFTDEYNGYADAKKIPDSEDGVTKGDDADTVMLRTQFSANDFQPAEDEPQGAKIELSSAQQKDLNLFISNFAEQGFGYYDEQVNDASLFCTFAYRWSRINKQSNVKIDGQYYKISFDTIKSTTQKYFGRTVKVEDLENFPWKDLDNEYYKNGYFWVPAADGESYTGLAIVDSAEDMGDGTIKLHFTEYSYDIDAYWDNNETIPQKIYALTGKQAASSDDLESFGTGTATVRKQGNSYVLVKYED